MSSCLFAVYDHRFLCSTLIGFPVEGQMESKKRNDPISPLTLQQQSTLRGVMAATQQGFMKQYFFLISPPQTHSLERVTVRRSEFNAGRPLGETTPCSEDQHRIRYFLLSWKTLSSLNFGHPDEILNQVHFHWVWIISIWEPRDSFDWVVFTLLKKKSILMHLNVPLQWSFYPQNMIKNFFSPINDNTLQSLFYL